MTRLRALAAAALAAGASVALALPAYAGTPSLSMRTPGAEGQTFVAEGFRFDATAEMASSDGRLEGNVTVSWGSAVANRPLPGSIERPSNNARTVVITQDVTFPYNGRYSVELRATGRNNFLDGDRTPATATRSFAIDANPLPPTGVTVKADSKTRFVTISWAENKEPDRAGYVVQKQGSGGRWSDVFVTEKTSVTDESTAKAGGTYSYRVRAVRHAATPNELNQSEPSSTQSATVAPPPVPPTTTATAGEGGGESERELSTGGDNGQFDNGSSTGSTGSEGGTSSGSGSSNRSGPPSLATTGKVDLSDFKSLLAKSQTSGGGELASGEDEGTYDEKLPFGTRNRNGGDDEEGDDGDPAAVGADGDDGPADLRSLGFLAGGLLATVLAMHVLWVRSEVNRADKLEVVAPEGPPPVSADERFGLDGRRPRRSRPQPPVEAPDPAAVP